MKQYQNPHKLYARSAEKHNRRLKGFPKITSKCLNAAFASVSGDSAVSSPLCDISHANRNEDATKINHWKLGRTNAVETSTDSNDLSQTLLFEEALSETLLPSESDIMPSQKVTDEAGEISSNSFLDAYELDSALFTPMEPKIAANSLRNVQPEVLNPHNVAPQYKKLMDELTKYVTEDHYMNTLPEDFNRSAQVRSGRNQMLFQCFFVWIVGVLAILLFASDTRCPSLS